MQEDINAPALEGRLPQWTAMSVPPRRINVRLDSAPSPLERDWLKALAGAGSRITWSGDLPAVMIAAEPLPSPGGGLRVRVAAPTGVNVELRDDVGAIDTVRAANGGASLVMNAPTGEVKAIADHIVAVTLPRDSVTLRQVLVIGNAGWESKFVIAALEEEGWKVDALVRVAPGVEVTQGSAAAIDTSRYSAVVALDDASAGYAGRIADFVRSGGGLILGPGAAALDAMGSLRAGNAGEVVQTAPGMMASGSISLASLPFSPLMGLRKDAAPLEKRNGSVSVAARRVGAGRALQMGYGDTWRWRMGGGDNSLRDHRAWWAGLVSSVAYAPRKAVRPGFLADDAPMAQLAAAIGPRSTGSAVAEGAVNPTHWMAWLFILLLLALLAEVASRRLRGAR